MGRWFGRRSRRKKLLNPFGLKIRKLKRPLHGARYSIVSKKNERWGLYEKREDAEKHLRQILQNLPENRQ